MKARKITDELPLWFAVVAILVIGAFLVSTARDYRMLPVSDVGRDLIGIEAIRRGETPYQLIANIRPEDPTLPTDYWVAHSPFAILVTWFFVPIGASDLELALKRLDIAVMVTTAVGLAVFLARRLPGSPISLAIPGLLLVGFPFLQSISLGQLAGFTSALVALTFLCLRGARPWAAASVLGLAVAWRPWLAPLIVTMPLVSRSEARNWSRFGPMVVAAGVATVAVIASALVIGGPHELQRWLTALWENGLVYRQASGNLSFTAGLGGTLAYSVFVGAIAFAAIWTHWGPRPASSWSGPLLGCVVVAFAGPLLWFHYLLPLLIVALVWRPSVLEALNLIWAVLLVLFLSALGLPVSVLGFIGVGNLLILLGHAGMLGILVVLTITTLRMGAPSRVPVGT